MKVNTYEPRKFGDEVEMVRTEFGEWVSYQDYVQIARRAEYLVSIVNADNELDLGADQHGARRES